MPRGLTNDVPRGRIVQAARADLSGIAVVIDLADARREVSVALEHLRQRLHVGQYRAEIGLQIVDARRVGPQSGQQRHAARTAQRKLVVRAIEAHAARGEPIEVRRLHHRMAERPHVVVQIVGHDDEHVRAARRAVERAPAARRRGCAGKQQAVAPSRAIYRSRTRRNPRFEAPLVTSDLPRLPTR